MKTKLRFVVLLTLLSTAGLVLFGQQGTAPVPAQDTRDGKAIAEAVSGWWTGSMTAHDQRIAWWREAKFGCFIQWGVYSGPGGEWKGEPVRGYAEHLMRLRKIPLAEYKRDVVSVFNPVDFNADEWVRAIKGAGMKWLVITSKHHDGFAMYPSKVTRYNITDATPFKRDPMRELADACRRNGLKFGFYGASPRARPTRFTCTCLTGRRMPGSWLAASRARRPEPGCWPTPPASRFRPRD